MSGTSMNLSGQELASHLDGLSCEQRTELARELAHYLLSKRMCNLGYDRKDWRRICKQRYRARKLLKSRLPSLQEACQWHRLSLTEAGWEYTLGQCGNEEFTNLINSLCGKDGPWLS